MQPAAHSDVLKSHHRQCFSAASQAEVISDNDAMQLVAGLHYGENRYNDASEYDVAKNAMCMHIMRSGVSWALKSNSTVRSV